MLRCESVSSSTTSPSYTHHELKIPVHTRWLSIDSYLSPSLTPSDAVISLNSLLPQHLSAPGFQSSTCSPLRSLPTCQPSVDVKVGSMVSNSPSDTGRLTFHCPWGGEEFFSLLNSVAPHRSWRLPVHSGVLTRLWTARMKMGGKVGCRGRCVLS